MSSVAGCNCVVEGDGAGSHDDVGAKQQSHMEDAAADVDVKDHEKLITAERQCFFQQTVYVSCVVGSRLELGHWVTGYWVRSGVII